MCTENELSLCDKHSFDKGDSSVLSYIYFLREYKYKLEKFLRHETKEIYVDVAYRCFKVPLEYHEIIKIEQEIEQINKRLVEYERYNSTKRNTNTLIKTL